MNKDYQNKSIQSNSFYDKARVFSDSGEVDSSFKYYNKAKDLFFLQKDSLNAGKCLVFMGNLALEKGDYFEAQKNSLDAISCFDKADKDQYSYISYNYNTLGRATYQLKDYVNALKLYDEAIKFILIPSSKLICLNNKAKVFEELKDYDKAILMYNEVLKNSNKDKIEYARALTNISFTKWLENSNYKPLPELLESLKIREKEKDLWGQNHSYARLSDYYSALNPAIALTYALKMHNIAKELNSPDDRLEALEKLIKLSPSSKAKAHFESFRNLEDSVQMVRNKSKNQFALIRYETEKHKAANLILQKDNTEKKYQLIKQKALLVAGLAFAFFVIIVSIILYKKRKQRLELASQNAIRENQLKTSKKVHDVVANGLYRVMAEIENSEDLNKDQVLDKLEDMYEKSRDLSYEELQYTDKNFHEKVGGLLKSFAGENIKVIIIGNTSELWKKVNSEVKYEIEHILQELMVNMKKHSGASNVALRFVNKDNKIEVYYTDNGVGMLPEQQFNNGLTNTGNRIVAIDGEITFDTKAEKGLKIQISFPIS